MIIDLDNQVKKKKKKTDWLDWSNLCICHWDVEVGNKMGDKWFN